MPKLADDSVVWVHSGGSDIRSVLFWDSDDPFAVRVTFLDQAAPVEWMFGRELLLHAFQEKEAGEGDVTVRVNGATLTLTLSSSITLVLKTDAYVVKRFLDSTLEAVPLGEEDTQEAIDLAIIRLLDEQL